LELRAGSESDWFVDPGGRPPRDDAPALLGRPDGDFQLSAHVEAELAATFDAGALVLRAGGRAWAKLALERSPEGLATVVSVVTRERSDDCNSFAVDGSSLWLRVSRIGEACALHVSTDGSRWQLIRHFSIAGWEPLDAGFLAQSPTGPGCVARFAGVRYAAETLADIRDGS
jgi:regulation of enolase protein 1 (concanavalin A-like superfamily)